MKLYVLCGGSGERMKSYSFPKPLNMIYGKPLIHYSLNNIPASFTEINFIYSNHLLEYNFEEVVLNIFKNRACKFTRIDYFTRGPVESAYIGLKDVESDDEPCVFIDNDNIYTFPENWDSLSFDNAFLGCRVDNSDSEAFSFVSLTGDNVIHIKEKQRISNICCTGIYGFKNIDQFRECAKFLLQKPVATEIYMSLIYEKLLSDSNPVKCIMIPDTRHMGSLKEIEESISTIKWEKMRVCFDLDNTLVTYPKIPGDYTTVSPIKPMIELARSLHNEGHTVIIYTARRMKTHGGNIGAVIKDIGCITFDTLKEFDIPYDEIIFGKPIADVYIDDRAVNPYRGDMKSMGIFMQTETEKIINALPCNKHNSINIRNKNVCKTGSKKLLRGQSYFYNNIPVNSQVHKYFPLVYNINEEGDNICIELEYIKGIPLYTLYKHSIISEAHMYDILHMTKVLHNTHSSTERPLRKEVVNNYINKFKLRLSDKNLYPYKNTVTVLDSYTKKLEQYCSSDRIKIVDIIHGDLWFSNMILDFRGNIKLIDMRGEVDGKLTMGGDPIYDYAKIYQSLRGFDAILYNDEYNIDYARPLISIFFKYLKDMSIDSADVILLSDVLILGTFHAIEEVAVRDKIWSWITSGI